MSFDFMFILAALTLISGVFYLIDVVYWKKYRAPDAKPYKLVEYARSFFLVFLAVFIIRSFVGQLFRVPTGSLKPTVMPGDLVLVTQYNYGFRVPVINKYIMRTGEPKRGDVIVFNYPVDPKIDYVKRLIGLPGDKISYINHVLYVNGKKMPQKFVAYATDSDGVNQRSWPVKVMEEDLAGVKHDIYLCANEKQCPPGKTQNFYNLVVPKGEYFMMGDNRDNSEDGRVWGFVKFGAIIGKAQLVVFNYYNGSINWNRIGYSMHE